MASAIDRSLSVGPSCWAALRVREIFSARSALDSYLAILRQNDINIDIGSSGALTQLPAIRQFD
jgi:hypothetical protein